jgi:hypothetical protein
MVTWLLQRVPRPSKLNSFAFHAPSNARPQTTGVRCVIAYCIARRFGRRERHPFYSALRHKEIFRSAREDARVLL